QEPPKYQEQDEQKQIQIMNYTVNNQLRTSILFDGTAEARLADILTIMDTHTFGKREAAKIVGGIGRLIRLIEENKIRSDKPTCAQNGKWFCNASDVLRYAQTKMPRKPRKLKKKVA
ncbi:MAG: hypothetical protein U0O40_17740, partial [Phocaeicola dorei]